MSEVKLVATRDAYGKVLAEIGRENPNVVVLDADLAVSTKTAVFAKAFPERFFDMGVAEQDMIGTAAGLAASGKIVFASTFAVFGSGRAWDQVRVSVAYTRLNVKIVVTHSGPAFHHPERAFEPYIPPAGGLDASTLGLTLCATILRDNEGSASAVNLGNHGAAILLELQAA